jgi:putative transposase
VFATVRHRTVRTKGSLSSTTAKLMVFKLLCAASKTWRRLKGTNQLPKVIAGIRSSKCPHATLPDHLVAQNSA